VIETEWLVHRTSSPAIPVKPNFKGTGMKLGKKGKQSELLDAMGGEVSIAVANEVPQERIAPSSSAGKGDAEKPQSLARKGSVSLQIV